MRHDPRIGRVHRQRGIGTAADVVCTRGEHELVLVELKTGYRGDRSAPVRNVAGVAIKMNAPLTTARDSALHRHLAQLAATRALFLQEDATIRALKNKGVTRVVAGSGALVGSGVAH